MQQGKTTIPAAYQMAVKLYEGKQPHRARAIVDQILERKPEHAHAHHLRGAILLQLEELEEAETSLRRAVEIEPESISFRNTLGVWLKKCDRLEEASEQFQEVQRLDPKFAPVYTNIGLLAQRRQDYEAAEAAHRRCIEIEPTYRPAIHNLGNTLEAMGRLDEAIECFDRALALKARDAEIRTDRGLCRLRAKDYVRGWEDFEARLNMIDQRLRHRIVKAPMWNGGTFRDQTLLIYQEQGFGDLIQCARYFGAAKERGGNTVVLASEAMERLLETVDGVDRIITSFDDVPPVDFKVPIFSLPRLFGTRWSDMPATVPYVHAPEDPPTRLDDPGLRVGLSWAGSPTFKGDHQRSMSAEFLAPLIATPGATYYTLQFNADADRLRQEGLDDRVRILDDDELGDFYQTAGVIEQLDLVITVDTVTAHLAGALGRPVWLLLGYSGDWRWAQDIETSPWYPGVRIFRQRQPKDWPGVIERVIAALTDKVVAHAKT